MISPVPLPLLKSQKIFEYLPTRLLQILWPLPENNRIRDRDLKVLCVGMGRTGTDSLRTAMVDLGYKEVYHGFLFTSSGIGDAVQWWRLNQAKYSRNLSRRDAGFLSRQEFDRVLGNSEVVTDYPAAGFAVELLRAYPEVKVIVNRRDDVEAWHRSMSATIHTLYTDWPSFLTTFVEAELFWIARAVFTLKTMVDFDPERNGRQWHREHYRKVEEELQRQEREYLDWKVQDAWKPLCEFLGKEVPEMEFPNENAAGGKWAERRGAIHREKVARARRNGFWVGW